MPNTKAGLQKLIKDFDLVLDSITDGFFLLDKEFRFLYVNKAFERICKLERADVLGANYWECFPQAKTQKFYTEYIHALKNEETTHFEEYATSLDKWVMVSVYPYADGLGVYFTDITEQRKQAHVIEEQNKQLRDIAWMLSHNIRKPVASILGLAQLLDKHDLQKPENLEVIQGVVEAIEELDHIIKEIDTKTVGVSIDLKGDDKE